MERNPSSADYDPEAKIRAFIQYIHGATVVYETKELEAEEQPRDASPIET